MTDPEALAAQLTIAWSNLLGQRSDYSSSVSNEELVWAAYNRMLEKVQKEIKYRTGQ